MISNPKQVCDEWDMVLRPSYDCRLERPVRQYRRWVACFEAVIRPRWIQMELMFKETIRGQRFDRGRVRNGLARLSL